MKKLFVVLVAALALLAIACTIGEIKDDHKVTICHANSGVKDFTNPTVDKSSILNGSGHDGHGGDIIPVFPYEQYEVTGSHQEVDVAGHYVCTAPGYRLDGSVCKKNNKPDIPATWVPATYKTVTDYGWVAHSYAGKNLASLYGWGATGAEVLANGCVVPPKPYVQCSETVDQGWAYNGDAFDVGTPVWGDWVDNGDGTSTRVGVQATARHQYHYIIDARDDNIICSSEFRDEPGTREVREGTEPVYGCMDPLALNYDKTATVDDQSCKYPPTEPPLVPKRECVDVQQPYGMAQLFGPDNQWGLMYIYPDPKTGELPQAVGVQRQLCVLGWEAEREGYFGFVYRNSCTGAYTWNGMNVTPRPDVLKKGVCARSGACIVE